MKSRVCLTPLAVPFQPGIACSKIRQQRCWLLGTSILLILCWAIGAIWLIGVRRGERSATEVVAQQRAIATHFSEEMVSSRLAGAGNFSLFLVKVE